jgi:molecular chaperone HtpG
MEKKTQSFQAEVSEMLDLVVHSLYSKKEIFLRELVSNASDAIDKAQYLGLTDKSLVADSPEWRIDIVADKTAKTLSITDNGIGMSAEEAEANLGTIARSGTQAFMESLKKDGGAGAPEMIGQFGVGFYAAFMVADKVTVDSLRRGEGAEAVRWESDGKGSYTIDASDRKEPGTTITLHIPDEHSSYLEEWEIRSLVKQYSDFIAYPIHFRKADVPKDEKDDDRKRREEDEKKPLNTMRALWRRQKSEIKEEEYKEFYRHLTHDYEDPVRTIHVVAEGQVEYRALLFLPAKPGYDLFMPNRKHGLQLYVRNVFIGNDFEALIPEYLRFVKGVVDSSDLPLNVSREMLQDDATIRKIRSSLVSRVLKELEAMKKDKRDEYTAFFRGFGRVIKEGLHSDYENGDKLKELLLFASDKTDESSLISLREYRDAMKQDQKEIYYLTAESLENARNSPVLETFRKRGLDVLFMTDPVDDWLLEVFDEYDGCKLRDIAKGDLELGTDEEKAEEKKTLEAAEKEIKPLLDFIKETLKDDVKEVRVSSRLTDSASCLVADEGAMNATMVRMMKAMGQDVPKQLRTLELNPSHPLVKELADGIAKDGAPESLKETACALYDLALIAEGSQPRNPLSFTKFVASRLQAANS